MAKSAKIVPQDYPRITDANSPFHGCLDDSKLVAHKKKISASQMKSLIESAIRDANAKSSREILSVPSDATESEIKAIYRKEGKALFNYFKKYCGDPASTAHQLHNKNYRDVGIEQFRNRTLQKERMNSGWRYQFLAVASAQKSERFVAVSDIGSAEGDFAAVINFNGTRRSPLTLYVSVKNRGNTMGGADWPKAIRALETVASNEKNRTGPYCCVFGIAMQRGMRTIKRSKKTNDAHSVNTELWLSDFFWPFFSNNSYEDVMRYVLDVLVSHYESNALSTKIEVPDVLLDSFGERCKANQLVDDLGNFNGNCLASPSPHQRWVLLADGFFQPVDGVQFSQTQCAEHRQ